MHCYVPGTTDLIRGAERPHAGWSRNLVNLGERNCTLSLPNCVKDVCYATRCARRVQSCRSVSSFATTSGGGAWTSG